MKNTCLEYFFLIFLSLFDINQICMQVNNVRYNKILQTNS